MSPTSVITPEVSEKVADAVIYVLGHADDFLSLVTELVVAGSNLPNMCIDWHSRRVIEAEEALHGFRKISMGMKDIQHNQRLWVRHQPIGAKILWLWDMSRVEEMSAILPVSDERLYELLLECISRDIQILAAVISVRPEDRPGPVELGNQSIRDHHHRKNPSLIHNLHKASPSIISLNNRIQLPFE